jgi:hypothetical protein
MEGLWRTNRRVSAHGRDKQRRARAKGERGVRQARVGAGMTTPEEDRERRSKRRWDEEQRWDVDRDRRRACAKCERGARQTTVDAGMNCAGGRKGGEMKQVTIETIDEQ